MLVSCVADWLDSTLPRRITRDAAVDMSPHQLVDEIKKSLRGWIELGLIRQVDSTPLADMGTRVALSMCSGTVVGNPYPMPLYPAVYRFASNSTPGRS